MATPLDQIGPIFEECDAGAWPFSDGWTPDPLDPQLPLGFGDPGLERPPLPGSGRVSQRVLELMGEYSFAWGTSVMHRWADNVEAERPVRPPAFTFPDGTALRLDGTEF